MTETVPKSAGDAVLEMTAAGTPPVRRSRLPGGGRLSTSSLLERMLWIVVLITIVTMFVTISPAARILGGGMSIASLLPFGGFAARDQLRFHYGQLPAIVWQSYLVNNSQDPFAWRRIREGVSTWKTQNLEWQYRIVDLVEADRIVAAEFAEEVGDLYRKLQTREERELAVKVLTLYKFGGLFADMNTRPVRPIQDWIAAQCRFVCGYENDKAISTVVLASTPKHRVITRVYEDMLRTIRSRIEEEKEPLYTAADFTSSVSTALVGVAGSSAEEIWHRRANIVRADPYICLLKSRTSLHRLYLKRIAADALFAPDPTPTPAPPTPTPTPTAEDEADVEPEKTREPTAEELLERLYNRQKR